MSAKKAQSASYEWRNESEERLKAFIESAPRKMWVGRTDGTVEYFNREWRSYTGHSQLREALTWKEAVHPDGRPYLEKVRNEAVAKGEPYSAQVRLRRDVDGVYRWHLGRVSPVRLKGEIIAWIGVATDIHEQHEAQERQKLLTQEVSHRVKNSLALVASQLALQARLVDSEDTRKVLIDAYTRVQTIAGVHDHLWRQYAADFIEICGFLNDLCAKIQETSPAHDLNFKGDRVVVPTDQAVPIGLIANELITNALEYAYPKKNRGPIDVRLIAPECGRVVLEVKDQGVGLPSDFDLFKPTKSLGVRFITSMLRQLDAEISVNRLDPGTCFRLSIPYNAPQRA
jgi:PAS domain S-box-containing protein